MRILELLGWKSAQETGPAGSQVRGVAQALNEMPEDEARFVGLLALVMSRVAYADLNMSEEETRNMERLLMQWGSLTKDQAILAIEIAKAQTKFSGSVDNYQAARELREGLSRDEKLNVLHCLFAVSAADDLITSDEERTVRQIAYQLGLTSEEFLSVRAAYREQRSVLR